MSTDAPILDPAALRRQRTARLLRSTADAVDLLGAGLAGEKSTLSDPAVVDSVVRCMVELALNVRRTASEVEAGA